MIEVNLAFAPALIFITYVWAVLYSQKREGPVSSSLRTAVLSVLLWLIFSYLLWMPISYGIELSLVRCLAVWEMVVMVLFLRFVYHWIKRPLDAIFYTIIVTAAGSAWFHLASDAVIVDCVRHDYFVSDIRGPLYWPALIPSLLGGLRSIWLILSAWTTATADDKKPLALVLWGFLATIVLELVSICFFPGVEGAGFLARMNPFALMPLCGFVLAAVRRHALLALDVEFAISEILQNVANGIALISGTGIVEIINDSALQILGARRLFRPRMRLVDLPGGYHIEQQTQPKSEFDLVVGGELRYIRVTQSKEDHSGGRILIISNISEQKKAEAIKGFAREKFHREIIRRKEESARIAKLEQVGTTAGAIAHDFNNFIAVILGFARAAHDDLEDASPIKEDCQEILSAGFKARDIVQKVLAFSRKGTRKSTAFDLAEETKDAIKLLGVTLPAHIGVETFLENENLPVVGDRARIRQALMNLLTNAYQAMPDTGGTIRVDTSVLEVEEDFALMYPPLEPGPHALVRIKDRGQGMNEATLARAFEPFFTTKRSSENVGLGLSTAMKIGQAGGGTIIGESEEGAGSSFSLLLPLAPIASIANATQQSENTPEILYLALGESYDHIVIDQLKTAGYSLRIFGEGNKAVVHLADNPNKVGLVLAPFDAKISHQSSFAHAVLGANKDIPVVLIADKESVARQALLKETGVKAIVSITRIQTDLIEKIRSSIS